MFERILLPLDGSELAERALPYGRELARKLGAELILFHVCSPEHNQQKHMHKVYLDSLARSLERSLKGGELKDTEVKVTTRVETGEPQENVCNLVEKNDIGLIVMAAVGASGLKVGKMLGSVSDNICRTVPIPVMVVRHQNDRRISGRKQLINRILLTLDGSDLSKLALPVGEELAASLKVPITLFQMAQIIVPYGNYDGTTDYIPPVEYTRLIEDEEKRVKAEISALDEELKGKGLAVTHAVTSGFGFDAAEEIIQTGKKAGADLIVMSTHGRSGLRRWVLGSVAEKVLRYSEIPVLLVNARAS